MANFSVDSQKFLRDLAKNNDKEWFTKNKSRFEQSVQEPALEFATEASNWLEANGLPYRGEAKKSGGALSRIYRDTRFSNDKSPYHTHMVLHWQHVDGAAKLMPLIGLRFDGQEIALGAGIYSGQTSDINRIRDAIIKQPNDWKQAKKGQQLWGDSLKTAPKGYDKEHPLIEDIRRKQFMVSIPLTADQFCNKLQGEFQAGVTKMLPFVNFLADALRN